MLIRGSCVVSCCPTSFSSLKFTVSQIPTSDLLQNIPLSAPFMLLALPSLSISQGLFLMPQPIDHHKVYFSCTLSRVMLISDKLRVRLNLQSSFQALPREAWRKLMPLFMMDLNRTSKLIMIPFRHF